MTETQENFRHEIVLFKLNDQQYAIPIENVESVTRMVELTPMPGLPPYIRGVINVHGTLMGAISLWGRMGLEERMVLPEDQLIIVRHGNRTFALIVDTVLAVVELGCEVPDYAVSVQHGKDFLSGVLSINGNLSLLCDPEGMISDEDEERLCALLLQTVS